MQGDSGKLVFFFSHKKAVKVVLSPFTFQSCVAAFIRHVGLTVECMLTDFVEPKELKVRFRDALTDKIPKISRCSG